MTWRAMGTAVAVVAAFVGLVGVLRWLDRGAAQTLRSTPETNLSDAAIDDMLRQHDLFDAQRHPRGRGLDHRFRLRRDEQMVSDGATGLAWQRASSEKRLTWQAASRYLDALNQRAFLGYRDWRLPTLEEAMSLVRPASRASDGLHIDAIFQGEAWWLWTADRQDPMTSWVVYLPGGHSLAYPLVDGSAYVRAVRSGS